LSVFEDFEVVLSKEGDAVVVAELSNGDEGACLEVVKDVPCLCVGGKRRGERDGCLVGGLHGCARCGFDGWSCGCGGDGCACGAVGGADVVACCTSVSDGKVSRWDYGRLC